jgi:NAD(P)-dependent dehydrogenase (short-subunit alcohol dehydrogenase family)
MSNFQAGTSRADGRSDAVVVTGAAAGIGAACARWFAAHGWHVVGVDITAPGLAADFHGTEQVGIVGSVTTSGTWDRVRHHLQQRPLALRALVNNAALQLEQPLLQTSIEDFAAVLDVNVIGMFRGIRLADELMIDSGTIVNMGSILGSTADPVLGAYSVSKGAVLQLTRSAALALAHRNIRVNAVCPGAVRTPLTIRVWDLAENPAKAQRQMEQLYPIGRIAEPDDIAEVVGFLSTDASRAMTGSLLTADGGLTATNAEFALTRTLP